MLPNLRTMCSTIFQQIFGMLSHPVLVPYLVLNDCTGLQTPLAVANYCAVRLYFIEC